MIIIIEGEKNGGKTSLARRMSKGKKTAFFCSKHINNPFAFEVIENDTKFIIIDDIEKGELENIRAFFRQEKLIIVRRGKKAYEIKMPNFILINR